MRVRDFSPIFKGREPHMTLMIMKIWGKDSNYQKYGQNRAKTMVKNKDFTLALKNPEG